MIGNKHNSKHDRVKKKKNYECFGSTEEGKVIDQE